MALDPSGDDQTVATNNSVPNAPGASTPPPTQQTPPSANTATPAPAGAPSQPAQSAAPVAPTQSQPGATPAPAPAPATVANDPQTAKAVQHAQRFRAFARALAGGPATTYTPNADGTVTAKPKPLSRSDILMSLAVSALSGSLAGLSERGPGATGRAAEAGFQQVTQQRQQANQQAQEQARFNAEQQATALARKASIFEANSRALLNTSEAEAQGADAIDKLVSINRASGVLDVDPSLLENGGQPMTQAELMDAMKAGKLSATDQLGPVAGRVEVDNPDGTKRWEATHLVVLDPNTKVPLTQEDWDRYAADGVPGFPTGVKIGSTTMIPLRLKQGANEVMAAHYLANQRLTGLRDVLDGTTYADKVPTSIDFTKPGVNAALERFQKYVSHDATNLADPYLALQEMGTDKRNPQTGQMQPNPDAKYVSTVMDALGGPALLLAAHNELEAQKKTADQYAVIDSSDKANAVLSSPKKFTPDQVSAAKSFISLSNAQGAAKATQEARARAVAEGTDVQAMYRFGKNPVTGEVLSLDNAPPSMLVTASGQVIPQDLVSTYKPTAQERQTADTARQVLAISSDLQKAIEGNPALAGPLSGRSKQGLAKLGFGDAQAQKFLDDVSFLQSAATKMHTGRFSNEILKKMSGIIQSGMNDQQFTGALSSINDVASRYADEDQLRTVGDFKRQTATPMNPNPSGSGRQVQIPAGAQIGRDGQGRVVGYKLNGQFVSLSGGQQ